MNKVNFLQSCPVAVDTNGAGLVSSVRGRYAEHQDLKGDNATSFQVEAQRQRVLEAVMNSDGGPKAIQAFKRKRSLTLSLRYAACPRTIPSAAGRFSFESLVNWPKSTELNSLAVALYKQLESLRAAIGVSINAGNPREIENIFREFIVGHEIPVQDSKLFMEDKRIIRNQRRVLFRWLIDKFQRSKPYPKDQDGFLHIDQLILEFVADLLAYSNIEFELNERESKVRLSLMLNRFKNPANSPKEESIRLLMGILAGEFEDEAEDWVLDNTERNAPPLYQKKS